MRKLHHIFLQSLAEANIIGLITDGEAEDLLLKHYIEKGFDESYKTDLAILRIKRYLTVKDFNLSKEYFYTIHRYIFNGLIKDAGQTRTVNLSKKEPFINNESVIYAPMQHIEEYLAYDFKEEQKKCYYSMSYEAIINSLVPFIINIWQAHPFNDGNTRTVSVFLEKYLNSMGIPTNNDVFKNNSTYFRNALVRANYITGTRIEPTDEYVRKFMTKLLIDPKIELDINELNLSYTRD